MAETRNIKINSYNDFVERLTKAKELEISATLSYFKYCYLYDDEVDFKMAKELITDELEPLGLTPYKVTDDLSLLFKYKRKAEAIIYIRPYGIDLLIYKLSLYRRG